MNVCEAITNFEFRVSIILSELNKAKDNISEKLVSLTNDILVALMKEKEGTWPFRKQITRERAIEILNSRRLSRYGVYGECYYIYSEKASSLYMKRSGLSDGLEKIEQMINIYSEFEKSTVKTISTKTWLEITDWSGRYKKENK